MVDPSSEGWQGYLFASILVLLQIFSCSLRNWSMFKMAELGVTLYKGISGLIFKKILRFNEYSKHKASTGKLVSIVSSELQVLERGLVMLPFVITSPVLFIVLIILVGLVFKEAVIFGAIFGVLIFAFQYCSARKIKTYKYHEGIQSEKRIKIISDIINGIKTIKVYAWEKPFAKLVEKYRKGMMRYIFKNESVESMMKGVGFAGGYLVGIPIYGYNYAIGRSFNYQDSLAAISMLGASSILVFHQFFLSLSVLSNFLAILKRIGEVLDMEEFSSDNINNSNISTVYEYDTSDFKFCSENPQLIAIAGSVGSGKSTLLLSLMSKVLKKNKQMKINTSIAYAEQEPFIISGTLKDNILFGLEYDEVRMNEVIEVCCLEHDLEIFNKGLETEIGERGINASGGQKARISLARACYSNADVILLDDPLSAVDPDVAEKIFDE